jgi:glycosyltransferase involved in cell wall biosynthesis
MTPHRLRQERHFVIFEPDANGHQQEWLRYLTRPPAESEFDIVLWLVVSEGICKHLPLMGAKNGHFDLRIITLGPMEQALCNSRWLIVSGFTRLWLMKRYLRQTGAEAGAFLAIDVVALPLACRIWVSGRPVVGILFRPSVHYARIGPYAAKWRERVRDFRKDISYRLMLNNRNVRTVLSLDPYFRAHALSHYFNGSKVLSIPDPAPAEIILPNPVPDWIGNLPCDRMLFVLFGYLTERKGVLTTLDAALLLPSRVAEHIGIIFAGRIEARIEKKFRRKLETIARAQPKLWLGIENRWLGDEEIGALVERADVVLAPYQRFVGSSGVLMWAAGAGKPLLTQNFGLIGRLSNCDYALGRTSKVH